MRLRSQTQSEHLQSGWKRLAEDQELKRIHKAKGGMSYSQNGNSSSFKNRGSVITAASRTPPWLASGWGCRGRRLSTGRGDHCDGGSLCAIRFHSFAPHHFQPN